MKRVAIGVIMGLQLLATALAQDYVGLSKEAARALVKKEWGARALKSATVIIKEAPYNETLSLMVSKDHPGKLKLGFDSSGVCVAEKYLFDTEDKALQKLSEVLRKSAYGWKRLNGNQQVSAFSYQRLLEVYESKEGWITQVLQTNWSQIQYSLLF